MHKFECPKAPDNFKFGKEATLEEIQYRIDWEKWAEKLATLEGHNAAAEAHYLTARAYENLFQAKLDVCRIRARTEF